MGNNEKKSSIFTKVSDTNLLLAITIVIFFLMYFGAVIFMGGGFRKPQTFFNILNGNATLNEVGANAVIVSTHLVTVFQDRVHALNLERTVCSAGSSHVVDVECRGIGLALSIFLVQGPGAIYMLGISAGFTVLALLLALADAKHLGKRSNPHAGMPQGPGPAKPNGEGAGRGPDPDAGGTTVHAGEA